ncbi:Crp/Fnr family transcriptional regulator [Pontivivens insulae]|uniref:Transcriptional activatory protein AadR n=1 Tax=Pontivivens insulae TaxID=1639689 RepID=A0A2R8AEN8_9RHOB|nr:Crp/Fnr family transcriptional regulator [Pontivivens insulae]RED11955.1 CRP-like cAMP-binding protein [Pontivivens insulae]SPF30711.1 Transcriptional activatory protein AadR [Pontivivens insulae]
MSKPVSDSCLVAKLSHYIPLSDGDRRHLARMEETEVSVDPQKDLYERGDPLSELCVVKSGWLYSYLDLPDGRRQIVDIHHPGDMIGLADIAYPAATTSLRSCTSCVLCPFPRTAMEDVLTSSPRLAALFFSIAARSQTVLIDTLRANGRMNARERLTFLLLSLLTRLRITNPEMGDVFRLPLSQQEIGDFLGLTNVSVSKAFTGLEKEGHIRRFDRQVEVLSERYLADLIDFDDRHTSIDTNWYPSSEMDRLTFARA